MKNQKFGSKIFSGMLLAFMMIAIMSVTGISSRAANVSDTSWQFSLLTSAGAYNLSGIRQKTNATKFYVNWNYSSGPTSVYIQTYGALNANYASMNAYNTSNGVRVLPNMGKYSVSSTVYESLGQGSKGTIYACFGMKTKSGSGSVSGLWSPDSAKQYSNPSLP